MRFDQENEQPLEKTSMSEWYAFRESLDSFTDDIFAEGRNQGTQEQRDNLDLISNILHNLYKLNK